MHKDIERILLSEDELNAIITRLAGELDRDYASPGQARCCCVFSRALLCLWVS